MPDDHVVEHEVITHLGSEPRGKSLDWLCQFVRMHGRAQPLHVLREMWVAGFVELRDDRERTLLAWECADVWRRGEESRLVRVHATPQGLRWLRE